MFSQLVGATLVLGATDKDGMRLGDDERLGTILEERLGFNDGFNDGESESDGESDGWLEGCDEGCSDG